MKFEIKKMKTGLLIKELRIKKGFTQEELAEKTELSARTIQRIETGVVDPRAYSLQMIAKALEVDYSLFVDEQSNGQKEKHMKDDIVLGLLHFSSLVPIFVPALLIWHFNKHKVANITEHFKVVVSFQIFIWLIFFAGFIQYYKLGMPFAFYGGIIFTVFFSMMNAISVMNNKPYNYFFLEKIEQKMSRKKDTAV